MTTNNLTEQWKKGELEQGVYYCNTGNTVEILFTWEKNYHQLTNNKDEVYIPEMDDCKVLAPVPSYEEWQAKLEENQRLKDLLKGCGKQLYEYSDVCLQEGYEIEREEVLKLKTKIDEVLND